MAIMGKSTSNSYTIGDNDYDIICQLEQSQRTNINDVMNLRISSSAGQFIRLGGYRRCALRQRSYTH